MDEGLFIGREAEFQEMEKILQPQCSSLDRRVLILGGLGGIGKTQLAITCAKRQRYSYSSRNCQQARRRTVVCSCLELVIRLGKYTLADDF